MVALSPLTTGLLRDPRGWTPPMPYVFQTFVPTLALSWVLCGSSIDGAEAKLALKVQIGEALPCARGAAWVEALRAQLGARAEVSSGAADPGQAQLLITRGPQQSVRLWFQRGPEEAPAMRDLHVGNAKCREAARAVAIIAAGWFAEAHPGPQPPAARAVPIPPNTPLPLPASAQTAQEVRRAPVAPAQPQSSAAAVAAPPPKAAFGWPLRWRADLRLSAVAAVGSDGASGSLGGNLTAEALLWGPLGLGVRAGWLSPLTASDPQTRAQISVGRYQLGAFALGELLGQASQRLSALAGADLSILDATSQPPLSPSRQTQLALVPFFGLLYQRRLLGGLSLFAEGDGSWRPASAGFYSLARGNPLPLPLLLLPALTLQLALGLAWGD